MITYYHQLHMFTRLKVKTGLRLASLGEKDEARNIARYVRNARIVDILKPYSGQVLIDAYLLDTELRELERVCHPLSPALSASDKFSQVLSRLDLIAGLLNTHWGTTQRNVSQGGGVLDSAFGGDAARKKTIFSPRQKLPYSVSSVTEPKSVAVTESVSVHDSQRDFFSVCVAQQDDSAARSGLRLAPKDARRNLPAVIASGRGGDKANPTTLRLRVGGKILQATKEPKQ
jgi:hypothetical protein